jgi:ParB/RepB/Spo0J family partition protein
VSEFYTVKDIPIKNIFQRDNIRQKFIEIDEFAENIKQYGLLQLITVYPENDKYVVKIGNRRFLALKKLNQMDSGIFNTVPCIITNSENIYLDQLIENVQRVGISAKELCIILSSMRKQGMALKEIAMIMGKSEGYIKNLFVVINELDKDADLKIYLDGNAGVTMLDIKEVIAVKDKVQRKNILEKRRKGEISRKETRNEISALKSSRDVKHLVEKADNKIQISINKLPDNTGFNISFGKAYQGEILSAIEEKLLKLLDSANFEIGI